MDKMASTVIIHHIHARHSATEIVFVLVVTFEWLPSPHDLVRIQVESSHCYP